MGKITENAKYLMKFSLEADSLVERPDVIGAIFGQTEGLLGQGMDLKELQESGRIGRIEINFESKEGKGDGKTRAEIIVPSNLSIKETVLLAASIETVDKVGFTTATVKLKDIEDIRNSKRTYIESRSKELLSGMYGRFADPKETLDKLSKDVKIAEAIDYKGLCAGPDVPRAREIIIVEGRADVINLLKYGIKNAIAVNGSKVSESIKDVVRGKNVTVFLDGDRGGDMILKRLKQLIRVDYVARAPDGKEVEELAGKELRQCLRSKKRDSSDRKSTTTRSVERKPTTSVKEPVELPEDLNERIGPILKDMLGTKEVRFLDSNLDEVHKASYGELQELLKIVDFDNVSVILMDGKLTKELAEQFEKSGISAVACFDKGRFRTNLKVLCISDF